MLLYSATASAQAVGVDDMFANFGVQSIKLMKLVVYGTIIAGIFISGKGILALKEHADGGGRTSLKTPFTLMIIGVLMVALPSTIEMATQTMALGGNSATKVFTVGGSAGAPAGFHAALKGVLLFVQLIGHIALVRGLFIFKGLGEGKQGAEFGRGLTHILGGAMAVNINKTIEVLSNSVGMPL